MRSLILAAATGFTAGAAVCALVTKPPKERATKPPKESSSLAGDDKEATDVQTEPSSSSARIVSDGDSDGDSNKAAWTIHGWLASLDLAAVAAAALTPPSSSTKPLEFLRDESACTPTWLSQRLSAAGVGGLTDTVWVAVKQLRASSTPMELQDKFLQGGAGLLSYSGLNTFFGGLEAKVGSPQPDVHMAMAAEHMKKEDSIERITTENYGITTTSSIEWRFVAEPESPPHGGWPVEERLRMAHAISSSPDASQSSASRIASTAKAGVTLAHPTGHRRWGHLNLALRKLAASGAHHRTALPLSALEDACNAPNAKLASMREPLVTLDEAIGARLYTGPLFVKYNAVLRGLETDVEFLRTSLVRKCCSAAVASAYESGGTVGQPPVRATWEVVRLKHLNTYTTTLHAINSAIVKLSKLTVASKVYRGVAGRLLPQQFWLPNEFGVCGGIEGAFMSTTTDRNVSMSYASSEMGGFVFEIQQGMIDRGADISALSQYSLTRRRSSSRRSRASRSSARASRAPS